jgi:hypothetical protein
LRGLSFRGLTRQGPRLAFKGRALDSPERAARRVPGLGPPKSKLVGANEFDQAWIHTQLCHLLLNAKRIPMIADLPFHSISIDISHYFPEVRKINVPN